MPIVRLASVPGNTFFRLGAPPYLAANVAVPVGIQFPFWPQIADVSSVSAGDLGVAQYLWYLNAVNPALVATGETIFFAREVNIVVPILAVAITNTISVKIATDNAFQARMTVTPTPVGAPVIFNFNDGITAQNFADPGPPFNWQKIYNFTVEMPLAIGATGFNLEFEVKTVNYAQTGGTQFTNTAGLIYDIEIGGFLAAPILPPTLAEVQPPTITNPLA
ncbi:MAG: hypothetical protein VR69_06250 [Peptococcaceae bacterium BRH_c4b]|nr:MAG: hypothetical protein VR69_06250 [Peptococcaceae bacterium BRH_c4b]